MNPWPDERISRSIERLCTTLRSRRRHQIVPWVAVVVSLAAAGVSAWQLAEVHDFYRATTAPRVSILRRGGVQQGRDYGVIIENAGDHPAEFVAVKTYYMGQQIPPSNASRPAFVGNTVIQAILRDQGLTAPRPRENVFLIAAMRQGLYVRSREGFLLFGIPKERMSEARTRDGDFYRRVVQAFIVNGGMELTVEGLYDQRQTVTCASTTP